MYSLFPPSSSLFCVLLYMYLCSTSQNAALNCQGNIKITWGLLSCFCLRMAFCCKKKQGIFFTERNETTIGCHLFYLLGNLNCWRWSCLCISQDYQKLLELTVKYYILKTEHIRTGRHLGKGLFNSPQQKSELVQTRGYKQFLLGKVSMIFP